MAPQYRHARDPKPRAPIKQSLDVSLPDDAIPGYIRPGEEAIYLNGTPLEYVLRFRYLGFILHHRGSCGPHINVRIATASRTARSLARFFRSKHVRRQLKARIFRTVVLPSLLSAHENLALTDAQFSRLQRAYHRLARFASGCSGVRQPDGSYHKRPAHEIRQLMRLPTLRCILEKGKLRLVGSLIRGSPYLPPLATRHVLPTGSPRGKQAPLWGSQVASIFQSRNIDPESARSLRRWTKLISRIDMTNNIQEPADPPSRSNSSSSDST
jgi:hypothetical protein